jgi:hypothetical protein
MRGAYAAVALLLLVQPAMFPAAAWLNGVGFVLAVAAIVWEVKRPIPQHQLAAG